MDGVVWMVWCGSCGVRYEHTELLSVCEHIETDIGSHQDARLGSFTGRGINQL